MKYPYSVGLTLSLQPKNSQEPAEPELYHSKIVYLTSQHICIELPVRDDEGRYGFFPIGTELDISFVGRDNMFYQFPSSVLGRKKESKPLVLISHPEPNQIERKQRRNFVRIPTECEVTLHPVAAPLISYNGKTVDLSGGGMALVFHDPPSIEIGDKVLFRLDLVFSEEKHVTVEGMAELLRVSPLTPDDGQLKYSFQFTEIAEENRQQIIQYCFNVQLEERKRRLRVKS